MKLLRTFLTGLMALIMVVTSGPMAVARVTPQGEVIVICTGTGPQEIMLGPDGAPMAQLPHCPDCSLHVAATLPAAAQVTRPEQLLSSASQPFIPASCDAQAGDIPLARGPPDAA